MNGKHEEVLNFMLANTCYNSEGGVFTFDLHCSKVTVVAECLNANGSDSDESLKYKIIDFSFEVN